MRTLTTFVAGVMLGAAPQVGVDDLMPKKVPSAEAWASLDLTAEDVAWVKMARQREAERGACVPLVLNGNADRCGVTQPHGRKAGK